LRAGYSPAHDLQHFGRTVLQRDVEIFANIRSFGHNIEHVEGKSSRKRIVQPYPLDTGYIGKAFQKISESPLFVQVQPIIGRVLRDYQQFYYTNPRQVGSLDYERLHRS